MIQAHESWQKNVGPFLGGPGVKTYQLVEIVFGGAIFFLDAKMVGQNSNDIFWSRYMFTDLSDLMKISETQEFEEMELTALHRYIDKDSRRYEALAVLEVSLSCRKNSVPRLKYKCSNGDSFSVFAGGYEEKEKPRNRILYRKRSD